jgi:hypothetical protein
MAVFAAMLAMGPQAHAFSSNPKTYITGDNTFYVYVVSGEKVNINFTHANQAEPTGIQPQPVTVTVDAPGEQQKTCLMPANIPIGQGCNFSNLVASKTGIWRVVFGLPSNAHVHPEVASSVHWGANHFSWNITVSDSTGEKPGRTWSELYAIRQPAPAAYLADLTFYYESEDGYLYRAIYRGYNGQLSTLSADAFGVVKAGTCTAAYQSIASGTTTMVPSFGSCGGSYKLFFEQPSDDLPADAPRWDGTSDWVRPPIDRPVVEGLKFTPDSNADAQSGTISYNLKNFVGQYEVKIDTNGDGNYDGSDDITLKRQIKNLKSAGVQQIKFNGNDKSGNAIPRSQQIGIKINISKAAEIHLVGADIEGRQGGIELVRLSGDNVPSSNVCWNDTELDAVPGGIDTDLVLDGRNCPDSTGGVHKWKYSETEAVTWGNARYIDDWAYASARVSGTAEIKYPQTESVPEAIAKRSMGYGVLIAIGVIAIAVIVGVIFFIKHRRQKKAQEALLPPSNPNQPPQF